MKPLFIQVNEFQSDICLTDFLNFYSDQKLPSHFVFYLWNWIVIQILQMYELCDYYSHHLEFELTINIFILVNAVRELSPCTFLLSTCNNILCLLNFSQGYMLQNLLKCPSLKQLWHNLNSFTHVQRSLISILKNPLNLCYWVYLWKFHIIQ